MKQIYFALLHLLIQTGFSQDKNSLSPDTLTKVSTVNYQRMDSMFLQVPGSTNSGDVYILPNSLQPYRHSSMTTLTFNNFWITHSFSEYFTESHYHAKGARQDLKKGVPKILFHYKESITFDSEKDTKFQSKYHIEFFAPDSSDMVGQGKNKKGYNQVIFAYLDKKYGVAWRSELRNDAIGFELPETIDDPVPQLEAALQVIQPSPHSYARFPAPTDPDEKHQLLLIKIVSVSLVVLLILYLLFRRRNRKTFMD